MRRKKERGQVLIIGAVVFGALVTAVLVFIALSALYGARSHARESLQTGMIAGASQVDYASLGDGQVRLDENAATSTGRDTFESALSLRTNWLASSPEEIAAETQIEVHNNVPWTSPFSGITHQHSVIAAQANVPITVLFFTLQVSVQAEAEVASR